MPPVRPNDEGTIDLDGRAVGYRWYGAVRGPATSVVISCHGGLSCGADAALADDEARARSISVLAIDRPGVAASGPLPGRDTAAFASDVTGVLDALEIGRAAGVVGWSLGGQYALAVAALAAERVASCAVAAGVPPLDQPGVRASLSTTDRTLLRTVGHRVPSIATRLVFRTVHLQAMRTDRKRTAAGEERTVGRSERRTWGPADAAVLEGPAGWVIDEAVAEATASIDAMAEEYRAWERDWGFTPADVGVPTTIWQGDQDRWVPHEFARLLVDATPGATLRICPGEGHLLLAGHWGDVLDGLGERPS